MICTIFPRGEGHLGVRESFRISNPYWEKACSVEEVV